MKFCRNYPSIDGPILFFFIQKELVLEDAPQNPNKKHDVLKVYSSLSESYYVNFLMSKDHV